MRRLASVLAVTLLVLLGMVVVSTDARTDPRLKNSSRSQKNNGWTFVHLEGSPSEIGFQHGYLLSAEIQDALNVIRLEQEHDSQKPWSFFRDAAQNMMWPHVEQEYREEMQGIADGAKARGAKLDLWDVVALNGFLEWGYYVPVYDKEHGIKKAAAPVGEHCSAFVATGSYTKDGKPVIAHNNWSYYMEGARWTIVFDIAPAKGNRILMDGLPGLIHSGDDFGINSAGIAITETTISGFSGYDSKGVPEFVRARKAMQYSNTIDDYARIMKDGNNGGYANTWLLVDTRNNEIASLELGLKNVTLQRTKDGYFVGSNFPVNPKLAAEETNFDLQDMSRSANARHARWEQLMAENKGKIDLAFAQRSLADHYDSFDKKEQPGERTLCGHVDLSPRGSMPWLAPYAAGGTVQNKAADAAMIAKMSLSASAGHSCGLDFKADTHLQAHPELNWEKPILRDMPSGKWTEFTSK